MKKISEGLSDVLASKLGLDATKANRVISGLNFSDYVAVKKAVDDDDFMTASKILGLSNIPAQGDMEEAANSYLAGQETSVQPTQNSGQAEQPTANQPSTSTVTNKDDALQQIDRIKQLAGISDSSTDTDAATDSTMGESSIGLLHSASIAGVAMPKNELANKLKGLRKKERPGPKPKNE